MTRNINTNISSSVFHVVGVYSVSYEECAPMYVHLIDQYLVVEISVSIARNRWFHEFHQIQEMVKFSSETSYIALSYRKPVSLDSTVNLSTEVHLIRSLF